MIVLDIFQQDRWLLTEISTILLTEQPLTGTYICSPLVSLLHWYYTETINYNPTLHSKKHKNMSDTGELTGLYKSQNFLLLVWLYSLTSSKGIKNGFSCNYLSENFHQKCCNMLSEWVTKRHFRSITVFFKCNWTDINEL